MAYARPKLFFIGTRRQGNTHLLTSLYHKAAFCLQLLCTHSKCFGKVFGGLDSVYQFRQLAGAAFVLIPHQQFGGLIQQAAHLKGRKLARPAHQPPDAFIQGVPLQVWLEGAHLPFIKQRCAMQRG